MKLIRSSFVASLLLFISAVPGVCAIRPSAPPEIWVTATSRPAKPMPHWAGIRTDAADQWRPDAAWPTVAAHARVAKLSAGNIENTRAADLKVVIDEVRRRHMALALEIGPLVRTPQCAPPTESYGHAGETEAILQRIRSAGGMLDYVAMDEPFYYGHVDPGGCRLPSAEIARQVAASIAAMRKIFPKLKVGDIEVVDADRGRAAALAQWADDIRAATGEPLAFLHTDVAWSELAIRNLPPLAVALHQRQVPFGIIYDGDADVSSDAEWARSALDHIAEIETVLGLRPDAAIFQIWTRYPTHVLPETTPGTLTNLALAYLRPAATLSITRHGNTISGRLTDAAGRPVAGASIAVTAVDVGARTEPLVRSISGTTPPGAASVVVGIRVDREGACACDGEGGAVVGGLNYQEQGTGKHQVVSPVHLPIDGAPASFRTIRIAPGVTFNPNLKQFAVTPGTPYTFSAPIAATASAEHAGYATLIFLDAAGKGLKRDFLWFSPSRRDAGVTTTDGDGRFKFDLPPAMALVQPELRAAFTGTASLRGALAIAPAPPMSNRAVMPALAPPVSKSSAARATQVWLGPRTDFMPIIEGSAPAAPWNEIAGRVDVVGLPEQAIRKLPDAALAELVQDLNRRHIALNVGILPTNWFHEPLCGQGIEGYSDPGSANQTVAKLLRAGASVGYFSMDEPLWFGHFYTGKHACKSSIGNLAERTATIVKIYAAAFPKAIVGEAEPFPAVSSEPNWAAAYAAWTQAFRKATGTPIQFLQLDFNWGDPKLNKGSAHDGSNAATVAALTRQVTAIARKNGLKVGMIYWGGGASDAQWMDQARLHIREVAASGVQFDQAALVSWNPYPKRTFPATDPTALSSLIPYELQRRR
ncbi:MAG: carboxypeptidase-like regulatory domain-containing protein [Pseudomonadota bacterium]